MTDHPGPRSPRLDGADDPSASGFQQQFRTWLRAMFGGRADTGLRDAIEALADDATDPEHDMTTEERTLLGNILKLRGRTASDIMVPRADIVSLDVDMPLNEAARRMAEEAHSRVPVYRETLDDVLGMVHVKDVLGAVARGADMKLTDMVRDVLIVAPSVPVLALLLQMRQSRHHLALIVDEFGGIDGLLTIEDLIEEIVGEIEDEFDEDEPTMLVARPDGSYVADARMPVEDFEAEVGSVLTEEERDEIDTLGGLAFSLAGRVPARGEVLRHSSGMEFEVVDADPRRIRRLRVRNIPPVQAAAVAPTGK